MSKKEYKISVIGGGSFGTAIAHAFADAGRDVLLWARDEKTVQDINECHQNRKYLKQLKISHSLKATTDLPQCLKESDIVVCAIPTQQIRKVFESYKALLADKWIINTSKGIEEDTLMLVSEIFHQISPSSPYLILSGPSFAAEMVQRLPTAITIAGKDKEKTQTAQKLLSNSYMRVYHATDVVGVELGGALKNIVAIAAGIASGLELGYNAQAAIINRGIAEIMRLGKCKGASPLTFLGLSGMGDLVLTCTGPLSRNRRLGVELGQGKSLEEIQLSLGQVAEGVYTAKSAYRMARELKVEMPITEQIYKLLYDPKVGPQQALENLMTRDLKEELSL